MVVLLAVSFGLMSVLAANPAAWEGFVAAAVGAGMLTALIWHRADVSMPIVIAAAILFRLAVFWLPPVLSDDAYRYVWDGVVQAEGYNPYLYVPADAELAPLHDEPIFDDLNSEAYYSVYPPASQLIFRVGAFFYGYGWVASYFVIKAILALMELAAVLVLARLLRPEALLLYAWNPIVVIGGAAQPHGEAALVLFLSLTLLALRNKRGGWASVWIACAGWVKLYPFLLLPFLWRRYGWRSFAAGITAAAVLAAPYAHPDVLSNVRESLDLYVRYFEFNAGPYYTVKELFRIATGADWSKQIGPAFRVLFVLLVPHLYLADWKLTWPTRRAFAVTVGAFFLLSTTIHPWYLLGILVLVAPARRPSWHWYWLSVCSIGTYLLYAGGPYWMWVVIGWSGWTVLAAARYRRRLFDPIVRLRAAEKAALLSPFLQKGWSVLDVGAGEGYVGRLMGTQLDAAVQLVDVVDMNRTDLPHSVYGGRRLPFSRDEFDAVILVFVLHHAADAERVLQEAVRVARRRVVILESTYVRDWERPLLRWLDRLANTIRSGGRTDHQAGHLHLRTHREWLTTFDRLDLEVVDEMDLGGFIHHQSLFVLSSDDGPATA